MGKLTNVARTKNDHEAHPMDAHVWKHQVSLNGLVPERSRGRLLMEWTLSGESVAALRTGFKMGPFYLDAGHSVFSQWDVTLISHGHADHIFSLGSFFLVDDGNSCQRQRQRSVFCPASEVSGIQDYATALLAANRGTAVRSIAKYFQRAPEQPVEVKIGKRDRYTIESFSLDHTIPSTGYGVTKVTRRLAPHYQVLREGLTDAEFRELISRANCADCMVDHQEPQFCYVTDTAISGVAKHIERIAQYPIILVECTFYHRDDLVQTRRKKHIHWMQILPYITEHSGSLWVLIHHSARYGSYDEIVEAIGTCGTAAIPSNVKIWIRS